jgi:dTDP-4-amino-4,6-dideoxygalactose transaminase
LQAIGVGVGDEVLVPTLTYVATFQAVSACGAIPVACDVRRADGLLDLEDAARRITPRTKAVMPVHYASFPGDLDALYAFAERHGLRVVEDAAHAFGCEYKGRRIGSFGDVACFSFDGIKNITSGEGGAIVSSDPEIIARAMDARLLGVIKDSEKRYAGERSWEFDVSE